MKDIAITIQMHNQVALNKTICQRWREKNSKSSLSSITKRKNISWRMMLKIQMKYQVRKIDQVIPYQEDSSEDL